MNVGLGGSWLISGLGLSVCFVGVGVGWCG